MLPIFTFKEDLNGHIATSGVFDAFAITQWTDLEAAVIYVSGVTPDECWFINKIDQTGMTSKYVFGRTDYSTNWTNRAALAYKYIHEV